MGVDDDAGLRVFISYRREDSIGIAGRIRDKLVGRFGAENVFFDIYTIPFGIDFRDHIYAMVTGCEVVLVVIGRRWLDAVDNQGERRLDQVGDFVRLEVEAALHREIPVVPLLVDGATMPQQEQLPASIEALAYRNGIQIRHDPDFHTDLDRLVGGLAAGSSRPAEPTGAEPHSSGPRPSPMSPVAATQSSPPPRPPLAPKTEQGNAFPLSETQQLTRIVGDRVSGAVDIWRNRDEFRHRLRELLLSGQRITTVVGRRGIGKSALVAKVLSEFERTDAARSPSEDLDGLVYLSTRTGSGSLSLPRIYESVANLAESDDVDKLLRQWDNAGERALPSLWDAMRHRRIAIVLDNLDDLQEPGSGDLRDQNILFFLDSLCRTPSPQRVVTTSQLPLGLPAEMNSHVQVIELRDGLKGDDAIALLRSFDGGSGVLAAASHESLSRASSRLFGVPRGLELLASVARNEPWVLDELLDSDVAADTLIYDLVSRNFTNLDDSERLIVCMFALADVPLLDSDVPDVMRDLMPAEEARTTLRRLIRSKSLGYDVQTHAVRLHPLDADFARNRLLEETAEGRAVLEEQLGTWYLSQRKPPSAWRTTDDVIANRKAFDHFWRAGRHADALLTLEEASEFLARKRETSLLLSAATAADGVANIDGRARVAAERCRFAAEFIAGSLEAAVASGRKARKLAEDARLGDVLPKIDLWLGTALRHQGKASDAMQVLQPLMESATTPHDVRVTAAFQAGLSACYLGDWVTANERIALIEELLQPDDPREFYSFVSDARSLSCVVAGDFEQALRVSEAGILLYRDSSNQDAEGYLHNVRGIAHLHLDELLAAEAEFRLGAAFGLEFGIGHLEGLCLTNLTWCLMRMAKWDAALAVAAAGADRLRANSVLAVASTEALVSILERAGRSKKDLASILNAALTGSRGNPDLYAPSPEVVDALLTLLTERGPS